MRFSRLAHVCWIYICIFICIYMMVVGVVGVVGGGRLVVGGMFLCCRRMPHSVDIANAMNITLYTSSFHP